MSENKSSKEHLLGVFQVPKYITIDDKYVRKFELPERYKNWQGKGQFMTNPPKKGLLGQKGPNQLFEKAFMPVFDKVKYQQQERFNVDFDNPTEKKSNKVAFGSSDAPKTREFTNTFRTEQWRETLKQERKVLPKIDASQLMGLPEGWKPEAYQGPSFLYDVHRTAKTTMNPKIHRDKWFPPAHLRTGEEFPPKERRFLTSSSQVGAHSIGPVYPEHQSSAFARRPIVRSSFYRRTGVLTAPTNF